MSFVFWFLFLLTKYLCLFSLKSMVLGVCLLMCSFSVSVLMGIHVITWYSLMFFLVYIGGLLVLFIYISSLKFNPAFYFSEKNSVIKVLLKSNIMMMFMMILTQITWKIQSSSWSSLDFNKFSLNLFKESEVIFLINIGVLLLLVLWVMTKLSFRSRGALRPMY